MLIINDRAVAEDEFASNCGRSTLSIPSAYSFSNDFIYFICNECWHMHFVNLMEASAEATFAHSIQYNGKIYPMYYTFSRLYTTHI